MVAEPSPTPDPGRRPQPAPGASRPIRLWIGGTVRALAPAGTTRTLLQVLREDLGRPGTKEGCAEGDCGACTVAVGALRGEALEVRSVNACIQCAAALDGCAVFTVEDLRAPDATLHPVQRAMVDHHGSQCGFCTPGFVMSLWTLYLQHAAAGTRPTRGEVEEALSGNLCRCTGYRPIVEAGLAMLADPPQLPDLETVRAALRALERDTPLDLDDGTTRFSAPRSLEALLALRAEHPEATVLAGSTDVGLWITKQFRPLPMLLHLGRIESLREIREVGAEGGACLRIGAGVSLTDAWAAMVARWPECDTLWRRFGSTPVRNAGTLGGNVANGSPIGDTMPMLIALGTQVVLASRARGERRLPLEALYVDYMRKAMAGDEIVVALEIPLPAPGRHLRTWKIAKRFDCDISAVCAGFGLQLDGARVIEARLAFGGMAAIPKRAARAEAALHGRDFDAAALADARAALAEDFAPMSDQRASAGYRLEVARNLLTRLHLDLAAGLPAPLLDVYDPRAGRDIGAAAASTLDGGRP